MAHRPTLVGSGFSRRAYSRPVMASTASLVSNCASFVPGSSVAGVHVAGGAWSDSGYGFELCLSWYRRNRSSRRTRNTLLSCMQRAGVHTAVRCGPFFFNLPSVQPRMPDRSLLLGPVRFSVFESMQVKGLFRKLGVDFQSVNLDEIREQLV